MRGDATITLGTPVEHAGQRVECVHVSPIRVCHVADARDDRVPAEVLGDVVAPRGICEALPVRDALRIVDAIAAQLACMPAQLDRVREWRRALVRDGLDARDVDALALGEAFVLACARRGLG